MATSCSRGVKCQHRVYQQCISRLHGSFGSIRQFHSTPSAKGPPDFNKIFLKRAIYPTTQIPLTIRVEAKERLAERQEDERRKRESSRSVKPVGAKAIADKLKEDRKVFFRGNPEAKFVFMPELELRHLLYAERHIGEVVSFPEAAIEQLDDLEMLNARYGFQYMRKPSGLIRPNTGLVTRQLLSQDVSHLGTTDRRVIVTGKGGTGKSFMLLQITAAALMQKYVVIAVPCGPDLVNNSSSYSLDPSSGRYKQADYLSKMLTRTKQACWTTLQNEITSSRHSLGRSGKDTIPEGAPLTELLEFGEMHPTESQEVLEIFLHEMALPNRPQILFLLDNLSAISGLSQYRSPVYPHRFIHAHRLWLPFFFTCLLNGTMNHPRAAVIAATSSSPVSRTLEIALGRTTQKPYEPIDRRIPHSVDGATVILAGDQLAPEEAMGLSSYYKNAGLLKTIDRLDGLSKSVGDEDYIWPESGFWAFNSDNTKPTIERAPHSFKRRGKMNVGIVRDFIKRGGDIGKEDPTDLNATMERLALGGGTLRGFWKACTRMSHY